MGIWNESTEMTTGTRKDEDDKRVLHACHAHESVKKRARVSCLSRAGTWVVKDGETNHPTSVGNMQRKIAQCPGVSTIVARLSHKDDHF